MTQGSVTNVHSVRKSALNSRTVGQGGWRKGNRDIKGKRAGTNLGGFLCVSQVECRQDTCILTPIVPRHDILASEPLSCRLYLLCGQALGTWLRVLAGPWSEGACNLFRSQVALSTVLSTLHPLPPRQWLSTFFGTRPL